MKYSSTSGIIIIMNNNNNIFYLYIMHPAKKTGGNPQWAVPAALFTLNQMSRSKVKSRRAPYTAKRAFFRPNKNKSAKFGRLQSKAFAKRRGASLRRKSKKNTKTRSRR